MPTPFEFLYKINSQTAQNNSLANIAAAGKKEYEPISHFFVDETKLNPTIDTVNYVTDAFGPVSGNETTKYRTTSVIRVAGTSPVKVFAICDGQVLLQPNYDSAGAIDNTKLNLVLKPASSYSPLKIKYFIYRGVRKEDLIDATNKLKDDTSDANQPDLLSHLWTQFRLFYEGDPDNSIPTIFPASLIGYDFSTNDTILIDHIFTKKDTAQRDFQLPYCNTGEHIANFVGSIGLDIVLDFGDYHLENQEELFKLDLKYARKNQHFFDTTTITGAVKIKRYKEHIHQFIDAASFWGSHIKCGAIKTVVTEATVDKIGYKTNDDIFTKIVNKYQTQNKIYLYIQGENNRSYNYFDATRKVFGFNPSGQLNETSGWPIIIEEITLTAVTTTFKEDRNIQLEYSIATSINELDRHVSIDIIAPNNDTSKYPLLIRPKNPAPVPAILIDKTTLNTLLLPVNGLKSCASFIFLYANLKQEFPIKNYYNDLFPVNFNGNLLLPTTNTENLSSWATYDKSRLVNLDDIIDTGGIIQNKLVFDNGKAIAPSGGGAAPRKKRKLYMAILKRNGLHDDEYNKLNIDTVTAGIATSTTTSNQYVLNVYNNQDYAVYKGTFTDPVLATTINSLSLLNENSLVKKNSFFHLGITDEEYNKLVYGQITVPVPVPPAAMPQYLPLDADNVFFHLEEVLPFANQNVQKFKLGFRFEDATGAIATLFPLPANDVFVYTIDGFYFFSKEYSGFQEFYNEFAKAKVEFRTVPVAIPASGTIPAFPKYNGEFGFDWLRIGDNGEPSYENIVESGYERPTLIDLNTEFENNNETFKALKREYKSIPTQKLDEQYFVPYLNLFSRTYSDSLPAAVSPKPPFQATLRVIVEIDVTLSKLEFDYDRTLFTIDKPILSDRIATTGKVESIDKTITITCLNDFSETQQIKVLAYPVGVVDKNEAEIAGIIYLGKNDSSKRKKIKFIAIKVRTNINGIVSEGSFNNLETDNLKNALYQSLIIWEFEQFVSKDSSGNVINDTSGSAIDYLDLTSDNNFKINNVSGVNVFGRFIYKKVNVSDTNIEGNLAEDYNDPNHDFHKYLNNIFLSNPLNLNYKINDYFTIFSFGEDGYDLAQGQIEDIGIYNLVLFKTRDTSTLNHEALHGLGLQHTHRNDTPIKEVEREYIYPEYGGIHITDTTDNVMSYFPTGITTWYWQSKIMLNKLK